MSLQRHAAAHRRIRLNPLWASLAAFSVLACASWTYLLLDGDSGFREMFQGETWRQAGDFLVRLAGLGTEGTPAFLQWSKWVETGALAYDTLAMSVLAMAIAGVGALLTFLPAARNVATGELASSASLPSRALYYLLRGTLHLQPGHTGAHYRHDCRLRFQPRHTGRRAGIGHPQLRHPWQALRRGGGRPGPALCPRPANLRLQRLPDAGLRHSAPSAAPVSSPTSCTDGKWSSEPPWLSDWSAPVG